MNRVITFHRILDISWFDRVVTLLKNKYNIVSLTELENSIKEGVLLRNTCHITIDDGDKSFYNIIYPVLKKRKVPATIFVSPAICLEEKNFWFQEIEGSNPDKIKSLISDHFTIEKKILDPIPVLWILKNFKIEEIWNIIYTYQKLFTVKKIGSQNINVDQLMEIDKSGLIEIGAHTLNHPILANENNEMCRNEIINSFIGLKKILGHEIRYFAYPNGLPGIDFGEREINILKELGCNIAFTTESRNLTLKDSTLTIPRYCYDQNSLLQFNIKIILGEKLYRSRHLFLKEEGKTRRELKKKIQAV